MIVHYTLVQTKTEDNYALMYFDSPVMVEFVSKDRKTGKKTITAKITDPSRIRDFVDDLRAKNKYGGSVYGSVSLERGIE